MSSWYFIACVCDDHLSNFLLQSTVLKDFSLPTVISKAAVNTFAIVTVSISLGSVGKFLDVKDCAIAYEYFMYFVHIVSWAPDCK